MRDPDRHWLVAVDPSAWPAMIGDHAHPALAGWAERGWPVIIRRPQGAEPPGCVPVGVPLPPANGRARVALHAPRSAIRAAAPPPLLADAAAAAPAAWRPAIAALVEALPQPRCYGSLAWQHLTGLRYLTDRSDLDLLVDVSNGDEADAVGAVLETVGAVPPHLDGELVGPNRHAVSWREWRSGACDILVKTRCGTRLVARGAVFA